MGNNCETSLKNDNLSETNSKTKVIDFSNIILRIETTNQCNFSCTFCPHSSLKRSKGFMNDTLYKKIIIEASQLGFKTLDLRNFGEPLLDKTLVSKTILAKNFNFQNIYIHTNGYNLDRTTFENLTKAGMNCFILSLSPKKEFEITRGKSFDKILNNLIEISKSPYKKNVVIDYIITNISTDKEVSEFKTCISNLGFKIRENIQLHNWASGNKVTKFFKPCHRLWSSFTILWDGTVALCCLDYEGKNTLGNLNNETIKQIINCTKYREFRNNHLSGTLTGICKYCDMVQHKDI